MRTLILTLTLLMVAPSHSKTNPDVDYLALATVMLRDGHLKRAASALAQVDLEEEELDKARYYTLKGVILMRQKSFKEALVAFDEVVRLGKAEAQLHLSRARCAYAISQCEVVESAVLAAGQAGLEDADFFVMRSECAWRQKTYAHGLALLEEAQGRFPKQRAFGRQRIRRLIELGLYQSAAAVGRRFVSDAEATRDDILFLAEALMKSGEATAAKVVLEKARLKHPDDVKLLVQSAHAWLADSFPRTAAGLFMRAALHDETYARDAAEVYREAGFPHSALRANARILKQDIKLRQRLAILIDLERFEAVTALEPRLSRLELLETDEELRYALAYAWFRSGNYTKSEEHLRRLKSPTLFARAGTLRKAMAECRQDRNQCE